MVEAMRGAMAAEFRAALPAYEERPRAQWVFDWSAQSTVTGADSRTMLKVASLCPLPNWLEV